jgi:LysR family transcriptional regulator, transcriptional activator for dmlA
MEKINRTDLMLLTAIRDSGSLSAAAVQLGIQAPAVTKRLAALERQLGVRLFFRTTRRVTATAEGELLCERAVSLLAGFEEAEEALRQQSKEPSGQIKLVSTLGFGRIWLGPAIARFQAQYPQVRIDLQLTETLPDLAAQGLDAAIWLWAVQARRAGQWSATMLARNQRVLVAAPAYLARRGRPRSLPDLQQHDCLIVRENESPASIWWLSREDEDEPTGVRVQGPLASNSGELARDWCLDGHGIMLRSLWDVAPLIGSGKLVRILPRYAMRDADIQWLAPFRAQTPKRVQLLREFLQIQFKSRPWELRSAAPDLGSR